MLLVRRIELVRVVPILEPLKGLEFPQSHFPHRDFPRVPIDLLAVRTALNLRFRFLMKWSPRSHWWSVHLAPLWFVGFPPKWEATVPKPPVGKQFGRQNSPRSRLHASAIS